MVNVFRPTLYFCFSDLVHLGHFKIFSSNLSGIQHEPGKAWIDVLETYSLKVTVTSKIIIIILVVINISTQHELHKTNYSIKSVT